jgi:hypothetical protein
MPWEWKFHQKSLVKQLQDNKIGPYRNKIAKLRFYTLDC